MYQVGFQGLVWAVARGISVQPILEDFGLFTHVLRSASGYKQTLAGLKTTSALHPGADLPGGPPLKVKFTSVAKSCLASIARSTPGRVRNLRTDSWAGSGLRAPFCLWNQSVGPLAHRPHPGGMPNAHLPSCVAVAQSSAAVALMNACRLIAIVPVSISLISLGTKRVHAASQNCPSAWPVAATPPGGRAASVSGC